MKNESKQTLISRFSLFFIENYRVTIILLITLLAGGYFAYTSLLPREGFPAVEVPFVSVNAPYFIGDAERVNTEVTTPLEESVVTLDEVSSVQSFTTDNFATLVVEFPEGYSSEAGKVLLQEELERTVLLPSSVELSFNTFNAGAIDGENDFLMNLSANNGSTSYQALEDKAQTVADNLNELAEVKEALVIKLVEEQVNPVTGESFNYVTGFNRVGIREGTDIRFAEAISIGVMRKEGVDIVTLSDAIRNKVQSMKDAGELQGFTATYGGDIAVSLNKQIQDLEKNAVSGLIAVTVVLILLVGMRAAFLGMIFIPTVLAATFVSMYMLGYSLNVISLFALILVLGLFVDDAIVIIEAVDYEKQQGRKGLDAIKVALNRIGKADVLGSLTTILVFAPLLFTSGVLGEFISLIPATVVTSLVLSLFIALTVITMFAWFIIPNARTKSQKAQTKLLDTPIREIFGVFGQIVGSTGSFIGNRLIAPYLHNTYLYISMVLLSLFLIGFGVSYAGRLEFAVFPPPKDSDALAVTISYDEGTPIETAEARAKEVEQILLASFADDINSVTYYVANRSQAFMNVELIPMQDRERTSPELIELVSSRMETITNAEVKVDQVSAGPPAAEYPFAMQIYGEDVAALTKISEDVSSFLLGLALSEGEKVTDVKVEQLETIAKSDGRRFIEVKAKLTNAQNTGLILEIEEKIKEEYDETLLAAFGLEEDALGFDFGQESENLQSFQSVLVALVVANVLIYVLLVLEFKSFLQPVLILFAVPFSFPGLFPGLFVTGNQLSFFVMLGISGLIGIVINNSIMLVDYANQSREEGADAKQAIIDAVVIRFRPILATSLTTIAGLLPLALQDPFWEPLTLSIIFGLASSLVLVILFFPAYFVMVEYIRTKRDQFFDRFSK